MVSQAVVQLPVAHFRLFCFTAAVRAASRREQAYAPAAARRMGVEEDNESKTPC